MVRLGIETARYQAWISAIDAYCKAVWQTQTQAGYPLTVTYPDLPTLP